MLTSIELQADVKESTSNSQHQTSLKLLRVVQLFSTEWKLASIEIRIISFQNKVALESEKIELHS